MFQIDAQETRKSKLRQKFVKKFQIVFLDHLHNVDIKTVPYTDVAFTLHEYECQKNGWHLFVFSFLAKGKKNEILYFFGQKIFR